MTDSPKKGARRGAGAAGAGGGTLLAVIGNSLPEGSKWKPLLIWASPSVAVFLGGLLLFLQVEAKKYLYDREEKEAFDKAKRTLQEALNNPSTSPEHRKQIAQNFEELESMAVARDMQRIKAFRVSTAMDKQSYE